MSLRQLLTAGLAVTACLAAALPFAYTALVARMGPTPEELADRFSLFAGDPGNPSIAVAQRILALDGNGDTYVARNELPERMKSLMRGDRNGDGLLSANEVKALVTRATGSRPPFPPPPPALRGRSTTLLDVVRDQKLPQSKHDYAMALVQNPVVAQSSEMYVRLRVALTREEYQNFRAAAARAGLGPPVAPTELR